MAMRAILNLTPVCGLNYIFSSSEWSFQKSEIAHIHYIKILTWLCGFRVKIAIFFQDASVLQFPEEIWAQRKPNQI